jgi:hypothetical protein
MFSVSKPGSSRLLSSDAAVSCSSGLYSLLPCGPGIKEKNAM